MGSSQSAHCRLQGQSRRAPAGSLWISGPQVIHQQRGVATSVTCRPGSGRGSPSASAPGAPTRPRLPSLLPDPVDWLPWRLAPVRSESTPQKETLSSVATGEFLPPEALKEMKANLIKFLPFKYLAKELTSQAEILKKVLRDNQEHFPVVFSQASHCLELVCGVEVKEVDPREHIYIMVPNLGLTCDVMLSSGQSMPKAGLLVLILSLIMQNGDRAPEEKVWGALSRLGVCVGSVHCVFGEPRTLLTHVWVQEGYLEYRQVPYSYPARYEFLWGPRAYAETSKREVMAFLLRIKERASRAFPPLSAEAAREEDEAA
ncbi:unnamed protein product [Rangifer tarandus platyrhynchus]|uniref:Uncharacterized protein n=2 Tax=Rangifer tarandus platyrhynchus TaxID=3082113 RepID=A0ACB1KHN2_RANTA